MDDFASFLDRQNADELCGRSLQSSRPVSKQQPVEGQEVLTDSSEPISPLEPATLSQPAVLSNQQDNSIDPEAREESSRDGRRDSGSDENTESFTDMLWRYIPQDSILGSSIKQRNTGAVLYYANSQRGRPENLQSLEDFRFKIKGGSSGHKLFVIEDIDLRWSQVLCSAYPGAALKTFLAQHVTRLDFRNLSDLSFEGLKAEFEQHHHSSKLQIRKTIGTSIEAEVPDLSKTDIGFHVDGPYPKDFSKTWQPGLWKFRSGFREDFLEPGMLGETNRLARLYYWRTSTRFSCCSVNETLRRSYSFTRIPMAPLTASSDLLLVDAHPFFRKAHERAVSQRLYGNHKSWNVVAKSNIPNDLWYRPIGCITDLMQRLFHFFTVDSVLSPDVLPFPPDSSVYDTQSWGRHQIFLWMLATSNWYSKVTNLNIKLQSLRYEATKIASHQAFRLLLDIRRELADAEKWTIETQNDRKCVIDNILSVSRWYVKGLGTQSARQFWLNKSDIATARVPRLPQHMEVRSIPELLNGLEKRIEEMTQTVNEEIQLVIGSAQVEDARIMKRQTEWTVALGVLAAIYLPLTLVTGIFGMNIREITTEATAPDKWSAIKAWGVIFGATVGSMVLYVIVRALAPCWRIGKMALRLGAERREAREADEARQTVFWPRQSVFQRMTLRMRSWWIYRAIKTFREVVKELDLEAQKMD